MNEEQYRACCERGKKSWPELAEEVGFDNGEHLRSAFRRERRKRGDQGEDSGGASARAAELGVGETIFEQGDKFTNIICASKRMLTKEEVLKQFKVNLDEWEVESFRVKTSEGYRKDRMVDWHVREGQVTRGDVKDSGKMLVVPLYHISVRLRRKNEEYRARLIIQDLLADAARHAPKYPKIVYPKQKQKHLYEIDMPDIHFGRLAWGKETGADYDIKIARECVHKCLDMLLEHTRHYDVERILLPLGNDYFNVNSLSNTTVHGTPQQEDTRWQLTFQAGRDMAVEMIEKCSQIAPVDVVIVKGNHDEERIFYLGNVLEAWFHRNPSVKIDNSPRSRKYYLYGKCLVGFTHGSDEKLERVPTLMPAEVPDLWARSRFREFHLGDKHRKYDTSENDGIVLRILRSLTAADAWTFNKGFVGSLRAAESFLWNAERGLIAQFTAALPDVS